MHPACPLPFNEWHDLFSDFLYRVADIVCYQGYPIEEFLEDKYQGYLENPSAFLEQAK